jgi:DNA-binding NarL/FixJ family response regulator
MIVIFFKKDRLSPVATTRPRYGPTARKVDVLRGVAQGLSNKENGLSVLLTNPIWGE